MPGMIDREISNAMKRMEQSFQGPPPQCGARRGCAGAGGYGRRPVSWLRMRPNPPSRPGGASDIWKGASSVTVAGAAPALHRASRFTPALRPGAPPGASMSFASAHGNRWRGAGVDKRRFQRRFGENGVVDRPDGPSAPIPGRPAWGPNPRSSGYGPCPVSSRS